jgi:hypothetical protein
VDRGPLQCRRRSRIRVRGYRRTRRTSSRLLWALLARSGSRMGLISWYVSLVIYPPPGFTNDLVVVDGKFMFDVLSVRPFFIYLWGTTSLSALQSTREHRRLDVQKSRDQVFLRRPPARYGNRKPPPSMPLKSTLSVLIHSFMVGLSQYGFALPAHLIRPVGEETASMIEYLADFISRVESTSLNIIRRSARILTSLSVYLSVCLWHHRIK